ncbi:MAG TPA: hypothetical protein VFB67_10150 [Candidatus Polarisedimenticolaceae bacterium]|nr:hypothetical protein [Candidatus Polarisedimenticolaceae bacterium]
MSIRIERRRRAPRAACAVALLVIAGGVFAPTVRASDNHVRFEVPEPFRVGTHSYDAGVIDVHRVASYNPSTSLLEVWVNGDCLGMVAARSVISEQPRRTEALFSRDEEGRLVMVGYRVTGLPSGTTYRFP